MLSKFLRSSYKTTASLLLLRKVSPKIVLVRYADMIPPSQYDIPFPKKFMLSYALQTNWEIIPLLFCTCFSLGLMVFSIIWAFKNKVDVVYSSRSRRNISSTMDLLNPTVHKLFIINQRYEPWPEMQDALDKMKSAEKRALVRVQSCSLT